MNRNKINKSHVTFLLAGRGIQPVGGFKVVYEYANRLSQLGYSVSVVHIAWLYKTTPIYMIFKGIIKYIIGLFTPFFLKKWFILDKTVRSNWIFTPFSFLIPNSNYIIATSWETSEYIAKYSNNKGKKLYLVQANDCEVQKVIDKNYQNRVIDTWKLPVTKIVISSWLEDLLQKEGIKSHKIFNGLNLDDFFMYNLPEKRYPNIVMMLYHKDANKGSADGLNALILLKKRIADLKVILFGIYPKPKNIEEWIEYYQMPAIEILRTLYNTASVFLSPSYSEGWGLPIIESMQCGCAVVTTNIGGCKDFVDDSNALCCKVGDINEMCDKLYQLVIDNDLRIKLAYNGIYKVKKFTWDESVKKLVTILNDVK
jgi:glycosyltransferase involved in cell wall biosynthesis